MGCMEIPEEVKEKFLGESWEAQNGLQAQEALRKP